MAKINNYSDFYSMKIQSQNNINFQAYKIARVTTEIKGRGKSDIDICILMREDRTFG